MSLNEVRPEPPSDKETTFPSLSPLELREHQQRYLSWPPPKYGFAAKVLFKSTDFLFPKGRSFEYFAFLELVARVPYFAWEHVGHIAQTQNHRDHSFARKIQDRVLTSRDEQDNEFWHLLIMEEMCEHKGYRRRFIRDKVLPQIMSFIYYHLTWMLYVVYPKWSYKLNADFETHAALTYAKFVEENPAFDETQWESKYKDDYGHHETVGDLLRQVAWDEEQHKLHSESYIASGARFSKTKG